MDTLKWKCPLCPDANSVIERLSEAALNLAMMQHIIGHEERAAQRAVDKARLNCQSTDCSLGKSRHWSNEHKCMVPTFTDFDLRMLRELRIKNPTNE